MKETKYGVLSDIHQNPGNVPLAVNVLKELGAEKILVNGDVVNNQKTLKETQDRLAFVLDAFGKSGLESFVQPGSHETFFGYVPVLDYFADKYDNIFDVQSVGPVEENGHTLIFMPGSDRISGGQFRFGSEFPSGRYMAIGDENQLRSFEDLSDYANALNLNKGIVQDAFQYANINDIKKFVKSSEKTIVVCHVPRKFNNLEAAVDMAEFGEATKDFSLNNKKIEKGSVFPIQIAREVAEAGAPVILKKENRGNEGLKNLYEELGITKAVSGHFHESGHRANDSDGNHVNEGEFTSNLFWNSGYLDIGQTGILTVRGGEVSYRNVNLKDYIKS